MKHLITIAKRHPRKLIGILLAICLVLVLILIGPYLWHTFVVTGLRPWNLRVHNRSEVLAFADKEPIRRFDQVYGNPRSITAFLKRATDWQEGGEPCFLVFNRDGFLMRQHCCFESVPGFLDSTRNNPRWYSVDTTIRLDDFISGLRDLKTERPYVLDTSSKTEYTVVYGWTDYFAHGERKLDSFLLSIPQRPYSANVLLLNMNAHDSSFSLH